MVLFYFFNGTGGLLPYGSSKRIIQSSLDVWMIFHGKFVRKVTIFGFSTVVAIECLGLIHSDG